LGVVWLCVLSVFFFSVCSVVKNRGWGVAYLNLIHYLLYLEYEEKSLDENDYILKI